MDITLDRITAPSPGERAVEVVERKGLGHPDTICDALAEALSRRLCRAYLDQFGFIAHHNVDKALLLGGTARAAFGGGEVLAPMEVFLGGRAIVDVRGDHVPVGDIAEECVRDWFRANMHAVDVDSHIRVHCRVRPGSTDLLELFERQRNGGPALANDTSCGVGFAPLSDLERTVLGLERRLNDPTARRAFPEYGEDVKVMGIRRDSRLELILARALVGSHISDRADYRAKKARLADQAMEIATELAGDGYDIGVTVNAADGTGADEIYLTVTGTSAESGDDGEVGRGNRVNGLITPCRPMTMEAAAGKNPVTHVGKLYNLAAVQIADTLVRDLEPVTRAECWLVSRIGHPINDPALAAVSLGLVGTARLADLRAAVEETVRRQLDGLCRPYQEMIDDTATVF